ncbi:hypothetical protein DL764_007358 [Monosporascus ibericus]|uniref:Large ribosomal subunit protein mL49 n=1 Tax=Monosporascus ibericus TaxID=155417 RepID=A0A4Q4T520_9PEZI|nr:hypothetical protein DL764_007358 [Monosporascus ibericus]
MIWRALRPTTAPTASIIRTPIRFVLPIRTRMFSTSTAETSPAADTPAAPTLSSSSASSFTQTAPSVTSPEQVPKVQLPYFVSKNNLDNFGVYHRRKAGGNLKVTLLKRAEGNLQALKHDLKEALQLRDADVSVNSVTKHIMVRGHRRDEILHFLKTMGF